MSLYLGNTPIADSGNGKLATDLSNLVTAGQEALVDLLYPVGSVYIGTGASCPLSAIKGTWTLKSSAIVTSVNTSAPCGGTGQMKISKDGGSTYTGLVTTYEVSGSRKGLLAGSGWLTTQDNLAVQLAPSGHSGIEAKVTRSTLSVNIWERTA